MNSHHLLVVFNKPFRLGTSSGSTYKVAANCSDIDRRNVVAIEPRFIKIYPHSFDLVINATTRLAALVDKNNRPYIINENDVDVIKEVETDTVIWTSPKAQLIIVEFDKASRCNPLLARLPKSGPIVLYLDKNNCIPRSWIGKIDLANFPLLVMLHGGITFSEKDAKWLEFDFIGNVCPVEKFYVREVREKNGGKVLWRKP